MWTSNLRMYKELSVNNKLLLLNHIPWLSRGPELPHLILLFYHLLWSSGLWWEFSVNPVAEQKGAPHMWWGSLWQEPVPQADLLCATQPLCAPGCLRGLRAGLLHSQCPTETSLRISLTYRGVIQILAWEVWVNGSPVNTPARSFACLNVIHLALRSREELLKHKKCQLHPLRGIIALPFIQLAATSLSTNAGIQFCRKETYMRLSASYIRRDFMKRVLRDMRSLSCVPFAGYTDRFWSWQSDV